MGKLDERLRNLDRIQPPNLWATIEAHEPRTEDRQPVRRPLQRAALAFVALVLGGTGVGLAVWSLSGLGRTPATPAIPTPSSPGSTKPFAVWPEDTPEEALAAGRDTEPEPLVAAFAREVLGWGEARVRVAERPGGVTIYAVERGDGPSVLVIADQRVKWIWSVVGVSEPDSGVDPPLFVDISEDRAIIHVDRFGANSEGTVEFRIGYGTGEERRAEAGPSVSRVTIDLSGVDRTGPGHLLLLFRDADRRVFQAHGFPLPAGDYTVG